MACGGKGKWVLTIVMVVVGSGTTTVWCGVTFVPNLLLLFFKQSICEHNTLHKSLLCVMWKGVTTRLGTQATLQVSDVCVVAMRVNKAVVVVDSSYVGCWLVGGGKIGY